MQSSPILIKDPHGEGGHANRIHHEHEYSCDVQRIVGRFVTVDAVVISVPPLWLRNWVIVSVCMKGDARKDVTDPRLRITCPIVLGIKFTSCEILFIVTD